MLAAEGPKLVPKGVTDLTTSKWDRYIGAIACYYECCCTQPGRAQNGRVLAGPCKGRDRKEPSGSGPPIPGPVHEWFRRFLTGVSHIRGTQCRKGRRTKEGRQVRAADQEEQGRLSQRRQKPRWNNVKDIQTTKQLHSLQTSDPQSLEVQSDSPASSPPFFWHCSPLEQSVSCVYETEMNAPMDTFLEMCHHKWHFRVSELVLSAGGSNVRPADKWDACNTNNYRNKLNLESGNQTVLSISSSTFSRQYGGPLAEGPGFSIVAAQKAGRKPSFMTFQGSRWWK